MAGADRGPGNAGDHTTANRSTYDRIAVRYASRREGAQSDGSFEHSFSVFGDAFEEALPPGGLVADLGCGPGVDAARLVQAGFEVVGMDLSMGMLSLAVAALPGRSVQADLRALPAAAGRLDGIWCSAALLHVPREDTDRVLSEFRRVLRPSGTLALVTAVGEWSGFETVPYAREERRWFVYRPAGQLQDQLCGASFRILHHEEITGNRPWLAVLAGAD